MLKKMYAIVMSTTNTTNITNITNITNTKDTETVGINKKRKFDDLNISSHNKYPPYDFNNKQYLSYSGKIQEQIITKYNHITYVLTSASIDLTRCNFVNKCWNQDLKTDDKVYIVIAQRDYNNTEYLQAIGLNDLSMISSRLNIIVIPDGPKTAGYTRSWCIYLASINDCSDNTAIWIRDDRRQVVPIISNRINIKKLKTSFKSKLIEYKLDENIVYSPRGEMVWKKKNTPVNKITEKWNQLTQVLCASKQTWKSIQCKICYPQGPILEDYFYSQILCDANYNCSDFGRKIGINTLDSLLSSARPGDTSSDYISDLYPNDPECKELAIQMAYGIAPALKNISWDKEGHIHLSLKIGNSKSWEFTNKPGAQGGGQTHAMAVLYMLYDKKLGINLKH